MNDPQHQSADPPPVLPYRTPGPAQRSLWLGAAWIVAVAIVGGLIIVGVLGAIAAQRERRAMEMMARESARRAAAATQNASQGNP